MNILILANCPDYEYTGSGYVIYHSTKELRKYANVTYYDIRHYSILKFLKNRASIYRGFLGKALFIVKLFIKRKKYDIIEFWGGDSGLAMLLVKYLMPKTLIVHRTNGIETKYTPIQDSIDNTKKAWYHWNHMPLFKLSFILADGIVTTTETDKNWAISHYPDVKVEAITCGLLPTYLNQPFKKKEGKQIGYVGTWLSKKGIELIKSDLPRILSKYHDAVLTLVGVGYSFNIAEHFPEMTHSKIKIIPFVTKKNELKELYKSFDFFLLPSKAESFGLVLAEAMACGCCSIAAKVGYATDLIHKNEVFHLENYKTGSLYDALSTIIENDSLKKNIALGGYNKVQNLNWELNGRLAISTYKVWFLEKNNQNVL